MDILNKIYLSNKLYSDAKNIIKKTKI